VRNRNSSFGFCCHGPQVMLRSAPLNFLLRETDWALSGITKGVRINRIRRKGTKYFMSRSDLLLVELDQDCSKLPLTASEAKFMPAFLGRTLRRSPARARSTLDVHSHRQRGDRSSDHKRGAVCITTGSQSWVIIGRFCSSGRSQLLASSVGFTVGELPRSDCGGGLDFRGRSDWH
jgi:hypothetical protein